MCMANILDLSNIKPENNTPVFKIDTIMGDLKRFSDYLLNV